MARGAEQDLSPINMTHPPDPQPITTITSPWVEEATAASIYHCTTWTPIIMPVPQLATQPHIITTHPHTALTSTFAVLTLSSLSLWAFPIPPSRWGPLPWSPQMMVWLEWLQSSSSCRGVSWLRTAPVWAPHWLLCDRTCRNTVATAMEAGIQERVQAARGCWGISTWPLWLCRETSNIFMRDRISL